jgi:hypothetical protein
MIFTRTLFLFIAAISFIFFTLPTHADRGPCKLDEKREVLICGSGNGAVIVIRDTLSPSQRLGLAWRTPDAPPTEQPGWDKIELLVLRIADGAVLSRGKTEYWDTGEGHVNRFEEFAYWSPDSRLMVRSYHTRYSTDTVELYAFDTDDKVTDPLDLRKILDAAARARLKARVKNADGYDFYLANIKDEETPAAIDDRGLIRAEVMYWIPKTGPFYYYTVKARVTRAKGSLEARIVSIAFRGMQEQ